MRMRTVCSGQRFALLILCCGAAFAGIALAQESAVNPLAAKQQMIRDRLARLEDRMFRLRETLSEDEPENADRLEAALERSGELGVDERVGALMRLLSDRSHLDEASELQQDLIDDLETILRALTENAADEEERDQEIARLEEARAKVEALLDRQRDVRKETADKTAGKRQAAQLREALRRLDEITRRQESANERTGQAQPGAPGSQPELEAQQENIAKDTKQLAEDVARMFAPPSEGGDGSPSESPPGGGESPPGSLGGESAKKAAGEMKSAGEDMGEAQSDLQEGAPDSAKEDQESAVEKLKRAKHELADALKQLEDDEQSDALADAQKKLAEDAGQLKQQMGGKQGGQKGGEQGGQQGGQKGGEQGGEEGGEQSGESSDEQTPGQEQVEQAEQHMEKAADKLDEDKPRDATVDQDRAVAELEDALAELEEALRQLRQEEQEEILRDLEARFRAMLTTQIEINAGTLELYAIGREHFKRPEALRGAELTESQNGLGNDAAKALHVLEEEGTTVVFPAILEQLSEDMYAVGGRLQELNVGPLTQALQEEIVATLKNLVEAIEKKREEMEQKQQQGKPGQSNQDQPLLPPSAELKLLKALQVRVHHRTEAIETERSAGSETAQSLNKATEAVTQRQREAAEIATEMRQLENGS